MSQCQNIPGNVRSFGIHFMKHKGPMSLTAAREFESIGHVNMKTISPYTPSHTIYSTCSHARDVMRPSSPPFSPAPFSPQATRNLPACSRAASAEAPARPCAPAATTLWTAEGKVSPLSQPTCQTPWPRCKQLVLQSLYFTVTFSRWYPSLGLSGCGCFLYLLTQQDIINTPNLIRTHVP